MKINLHGAPPKTPGEELRSILEDIGKTQDDLATALKVSRFTVNSIINGHRAVTPDTALRLGFVLSTTPEYWLELQSQTDLYWAFRKLEIPLNALRCIRGTHGR